MHDVKQGAGTFVRRHLVDKDDNIQKCTSQGAQEHRQLINQERKNRKLTGQRTHGHHNLYDDDSKNRGLELFETRNEVPETLARAFKGATGAHARCQTRRQDASMSSNR